MTLSLPQLKQLQTQAISAAQAAGDYIKGFDRALLQVEDKPGGDSLASQVVTQVDTACEQLIKAQLQPGCDQFNIALLSEESADEVAAEQHPRLRRDYFWCIDPLDGTLPFIQGQPGYAVSIALVSRSGTPVIGVIYHPPSDTLFCALQHAAASEIRINQRPWTPGFPLQRSKRASTALKLFTDRSFTDQQNAAPLMQRLQQQARQLGYAGIEVHSGAGAVVNALNTVIRAPGCYLKLPKASAGGGSLWDFAATSCVVKAAGGWATDIHGDALDLNRADCCFMNHRGVLFASDAEIAQMTMPLCRER